MFGNFCRPQWMRKQTRAGDSTAARQKLAHELLAADPMIDGAARFVLVCFHRYPDSLKYGESERRRFESPLMFRVRQTGSPSYLFNNRSF